MAQLDPKQAPKNGQHKADSTGVVLGKPSCRCDLISAFVVVFLDFAIWGLSISWMPKLFKAGDSATTYGVVQSGYTLIQLFTAPLMGRLSDSYGRTSIMFVSQTVRGLVMCLMVYLHFHLTSTAENDDSEQGLFSLMGVLVILSFFRGFNHTFTVAKALVGDLSSHENRRASISRLYAMVGFGFTVGSGVAMLYAHMELRMMATCILCMVASAISGAAWFWWTPANEIKGQDNTQSGGAQHMMQAVKVVSRDRVILILLGADVLLNISYKSFTSVLASFCAEQLGIEGQAFSRTMGIIGIAYTLVQASVIPVWSNRMPEMRMALSALLILAIGRFTQGFATTEFELHMFYMLVHVGSGGADIVVTALFTKCSPPGTTGFTLGVSDACRGVVGVFVPTIMGVAFDRFGPKVASSVSSAAALIAFSVFWFNSSPIQKRLQQVRDANDKAKTD